MYFNCIVLADKFKFIFFYKKIYFFYCLFLVIPKYISTVLKKLRILTDFSGFSWTGMKSCNHKNLFKA